MDYLSFFQIRSVSTQLSGLVISGNEQYFKKKEKKEISIKNIIYYKEIHISFLFHKEMPFLTQCFAIPLESNEKLLG